MDIFINDKPADITLDSEKTFGDVISGIELWISPSGNRIRRIKIDGKELLSDSLSEAFCADIKDIGKLEVYISSWRELAAEALGSLHKTCVFFETSTFGERKKIIDDWENCSASRFLQSDIRDIYNLARLCFSGEGLPVSDFGSIIDERLREVVDPVQETLICEAQVMLIARRMEELPLDLQTGKDERAAETIRLFSGMSEKLFRILSIHKADGLSMDTFKVEDSAIGVFMEEFNAALRELSSAYENNDTVLVGDITEYELSPRLVKFHTALKNITKQDSPVLSVT